MADGVDFYRERGLSTPHQGGLMAAAGEQSTAVGDEVGFPPVVALCRARSVLGWTEREQAAVAVRYDKTGRERIVLVDEADPVKVRFVRQCM